MKKLLALLVILIFVALGGYSFYWNKQAEATKTLVSDYINELNTRTKTFTDSDKIIAYESIQTSGWPFHVNIAIKKPVVTLPMHKFAKHLNEVEAAKKDEMFGEKKSDLNIAKDTTWLQTISSDAIILSSNLFATDLSIKYEGEQLTTSTYNGVVANPIVSRASIPFECTLSVEKSSSTNQLFDVKSVFVNSSDFMKRLRAFNCSGRGMNSSDSKTNEVLFTSESYDLFFNINTTDKAKTTASLGLKLLNNKSTKAGDKIVGDYITMAYRMFLNKEPDMYVLGIPASELGNNTFEVAMDYTGPIDPNLFMSKDMAVNFNINTFKVHNDLIKMDYELHAKSNPSSVPDKRDSAFSTRSNFNATPRYDELKLQQIQTMLSDFLKQETAESKSMRDSLSKSFTSEEIREAVNELWPRFSPNGNIAFAFDVAAVSPNPFAPAGEVTLNNFDLTTSLDGIKISGNAKQEGIVPTGEIKITCLSCENLLNRSYAYGKLVQKWVKKMDTSFDVTTDALFQGSKTFLKEISVPAKDATGKETANDWFYHIKNTGQAEPTLNDKPMSFVMESFGKNIAPNMPAPDGMTSDEESTTDDASKPSEFEPKEDAVEEKPTN